MSDFKVICINDSNKPDGFIGKWIEKNKIYTVVDIKVLLNNNMQTGYKLEEAPIDESSIYQFFMSSRFRLMNDDDYAQQAFENLMKEVDESVLV